MKVRFDDPYLVRFNFNGLYWVKLNDKIAVRIQDGIEKEFEPDQMVRVVDYRLYVEQ